MVPTLQIRQAIERFLEAAKSPALMEAGEESMALAGDNLVLEDRAQTVVLQAWDERRNLVRRITAIESESRGRLELRFERFAKKTGTLTLLDLNRGVRQQLELRTSRLEFREQFRRFLKRQFPSHKIATLSTEANLEESLSPAYARALIRQGTSAWAAMGAGPDSLNPSDVLSFGLIWLDYLRRTERGLTVRGLILLLPAGREKTTCLRLKCLNTQIAEYQAFAYSEDGMETALDLRDYGNLDTRLEPVRRRIAGRVDQLMAPLVENGGIETVDLPGGDVSYRIHGLEFARTAGDTLLLGLETKRVTNASMRGDVQRFASELARLRSNDAIDRLNPLYLRGRELWLESQVRAHLDEIDACLRPAPVYGQAPTFASGERGIIDLLAVDYDGRLAILELKASQDIHLPLQALDYWIRVNWHLERREFEPAGYFPGVALRSDPPRMLLIAPALDFHPSNECVLRYFSPAIEVERIGVGLEWQRELKIMFRM
ncbi:MAG: hypothetical protein ABSH09_35760 [Bryobacteraceae bacterium]